MKIEELLKNTGIISGLLIFFGFLELYFYYTNFHVNIINFLELSEILVIFLGDLFILAFLTILLLIYYYFFYKNEFPDKIIMAYKNADFKDRIKRYLRKISGYILVGTFYFSAVWFIGRNRDLVLYTFLVTWGPLLSLSIIRVIQMEFIIRNNKFFPHFLFIIFTLCVSSILFFIAVMKADFVKSGLYKGTEVQINDTILKSDITEYYIGNTKNYIFFYNDTAKVARIFPMGAVKEIKLKKKNFYELMKRN
jgi:hypothetical protein